MACVSFIRHATTTAEAAVRAPTSRMAVTVLAQSAMLPATSAPTVNQASCESVDVHVGTVSGSCRVNRATVASQEPASRHAMGLVRHRKS